MKKVTHKLYIKKYVYFNTTAVVLTNICIVFNNITVLHSSCVACSCEYHVTLRISCDIESIVAVFCFWFVPWQWGSIVSSRTVGKALASRWFLHEMKTHSESRNVFKNARNKIEATNVAACSPQILCFSLWTGPIPSRHTPRLA